MKKTNYVLFLAVLMAVATALGGCKKEEPLPKTNSKPTNKNITKTPMAPNDSSLLVPMDDPGPVAQMWTAPRKTATITWNWYDWIMYGAWINNDSVIYYANNPDIEFITLMPDTTSWQSNVIPPLTYTPYDFHVVRGMVQDVKDYLEQHGKIVNGGNAIVYVSKYNGAHLPNNYDLYGFTPYGMSWEDSTWYATLGGDSLSPFPKGYRIMRDYSNNYKSSDTVSRTNAQKLLGRKITKSR